MEWSWYRMKVRDVLESSRSDDCTSVWLVNGTSFQGVKELIDHLDKTYWNPTKRMYWKYNETWGKHDNHQRKMLGTNHAKSVGTWRKPEWLLGTNYDDAVNMLEKDSESAGKCDNNQRKWCKNDRKMKETGKTLGKIHWKCSKLEEMVQKGDG